MKNRIAELRKAKKLTLKSIAEKLGVSEGYISQLQLKKALPGPHRVKLAQIFGVSPDQVSALDAKAVVRRRRGGGGGGAKARGGRGRRGAATGGLAEAIAAAQAALGGVERAIGGPERELLELLPRISGANRQVLLTLARSFAAGG
jgi:transcriptional regulator with XRE-family HTH domain